MKQSWVKNEIKYQRALAQAKDRDNEAEVKELYASYGGQLDIVEEVISEPVATIESEEVEPTPSEVIETLPDPTASETIEITQE